METSNLVDFLSCWGDSIAAENKVAYRKVIEGSALKSFGDYDEFYLAVLYPFENFIEGFIRSEISDNNDVVFLMGNSQFIEHHFQELIIKKEGSACCADKSRTIMRKLITFYSTGEKIEFDYDNEYTYHLPKEIFKTHEQIITFYEGLKSFFYGRSERYLKSLHTTLEI